MTAMSRKRRPEKEKLPKYVRKTAGGYQVFMASEAGGKQRSQGTYATAEQAGRRADEVLRYRNALSSPGSGPSALALRLSDMTVGEAFELWHAEREHTYVDHHEWIAIGASAKNHVLAEFGAVKVSDMRRRMVEKWARRKIDEHGYAVSTVRNWIGIIRQLSKWYVETCREESVLCAPALDVSTIRLAPPTKPRTPPRARQQSALSIQQLILVLLRLPPVHRIICVLQFCMGLRVGEAFGLSVHSIDWERKSCDVVQNVNRGEINQRPAAVSAIKVDGQRAYARVRAGEDVELPERSVTVHSFDVLGFEHHDGFTDVDVEVHCSSGTYIRSLARDLGAVLGVGGHLTALRRTASGRFTEAQAVALDEVTARSLMPLSQAARELFCAVDLDARLAAEVRFGRPLPLNLPTLSAVFSPEGEFLALYGPNAEGTMAKPVSVFVSA